MKKKPSKKALPKYKKLPKYYPGGTYNGYQESSAPWSIDTSGNTVATGGRRGPIASAADQDQINQEAEGGSWNGPSAAQYAQGAAEVTKGAIRINEIQNSDLGDTNKTNQTATALGDTATGVAGVVPGVGAGTAIRKPLTKMIGTKTGIQRASTNAAAGPHELFFDSLGQYKSGDNGQQKLGSVLASAGAIGGGTKLAQNASITFNKDKETKGAWGFYNDMSGLTSRNNQQRDMDLENNPIATPAPWVQPEKSREDAVWQRDNGYYGDAAEFAMGGVNGIPNAEVEREEVMRSPDGSTMQVDGPSHEQGGVPVSLEPGTQIYSDRLKMPGTKKTFAKLAERFKTGKEEKVLADSKADSTAKATANLIASVKQKKLTELFQAQESLKQSKVQAYAKKLGVTLPQAQMPQMKHGGTLPKYPFGTDGQWIDEEAIDPVDYTTQSGIKPMNFAPTDDSYLRNEQRATPFYRTPMETLPVRQGTIPKQEISTGSTPSLSGIQGYQGEPTPRKNRNYNEYIEPTVNTLLQNSGNIADLIMTKGGKKYDKEDSGQLDPRFVKPQTVDATESIRDAYRNAAANRNSLKEMVGGNAGAYMANLGASTSQRGLDIAAIRQQNRNTNTGILNDADTTNTGITNQFAQHNQSTRMLDKANEQQNKARSEDIARQAIRGIGTNSSSAYRDYKSGKMDKNTASMIGSMFTNYKLDMNDPNAWKWVFSTLNK